MIIKRNGKIKKRQHRFVCKECRAIFIAEGDEFTKTTFQDRGDMVCEYSCTCPCCGAKVYDYE